MSERRWWLYEVIDEESGDSSILADSFEWRDSEEEIIDILRNRVDDAPSFCVGYMAVTGEVIDTRGALSSFLQNKGFFRPPTLLQKLAGADKKEVLILPDVILVRRLEED